MKRRLAVLTLLACLPAFTASADDPAQPPPNPQQAAQSENAQQDDAPQQDAKEQNKNQQEQDQQDKQQQDEQRRKRQEARKQQQAKEQQAGEHHHPGEQDLPKEAVAKLIPTVRNTVNGVIVLQQQGEDVHVTGEVWNLSPGEHGFHIHEFGDTRAGDGTSAGGHYNPDGHDHAGPDANMHHAGDLGNITAGGDGRANVDVVAKGLKVHFVIGRSIVVHGGRDDLSSQPSGNAGPRVAVGVIGFAEVKMMKGDKPANPQAAAKKKAANNPKPADANAPQDKPKPKQPANANNNPDRPEAPAKPPAPPKPQTPADGENE